MLYTSFSNILIDLGEIMSLLKSSVLKGVMYLKAKKKVYKHLLHFPSGLGKKIYTIDVHKYW
jgi:hypothetical protein